jgi:hypothetical protein
MAKHKLSDDELDDYTFERARDPLPWHPDTLPPAGFMLDHDGVTFEAIDVRPHTGSQFPGVFLVRWRTHCTGCGAEIVTISTAEGWRDLHRKQCRPCFNRPPLSDAKFAEIGGRAATAEARIRAEPTISMAEAEMFVRDAWHDSATQTWCQAGHEAQRMAQSFDNHHPAHEACQRLADLFYRQAEHQRAVLRLVYRRDAPV